MPIDNPYSYINNLPPELLVRIFKLLHFTSLFRCLLVARHWHSAALGEATLWTCPQLWLHKRTLAMLERSKQAPLDIQIHGGTTLATTAAVLGHIGRIRTLKITVPMLNKLDYLDVLVASFTSRKASLLEELDMPDETEESEQAVEALAAFFRALDRRVLRTLRVGSIQFDWKWLRFPGLRQLKLHRSIPSTSISHFLGVLCHMPVLEELEFFFSIFQADSVFRPQIVVTQLKNLWQLTVWDVTVGRLPVLLNSLSLPALRALKLTYNVHRNCLSSRVSGADGIDDISPNEAILSTINRGQFGALSYLELELPAVALIVKSEECQRLPQFVGIYQIGNIHRYETSSALNHAHTLVQGISDMCMIQTARITGHRGPISSSGSVARILQSFGGNSNLETVELWDSDMCADMFPIDYYHPKTLLPFRRLRTIRWVSGVFRDVAALGELQEWLLMRYTCGVPVQRLVFDSCELSEMDMNILQAFVVAGG